MVDIATTWDNQHWRGDWSLDENGSLSGGNDMETGVVLSLFTDRTALPDDVIPDNGTIRGWWADTYRTYPLGSRLWLLWREKQTETTRRRAEEYALESLEWLIECGAAREIEVEASWRARGMLDLVIMITAPTGLRRVWQYPLAWASMGGASS